MHYRRIMAADEASYCTNCTIPSSDPPPSLVICNSLPAQPRAASLTLPLLSVIAHHVLPEEVFNLFRYSSRLPCNLFVRQFSGRLVIISPKFGKLLEFGPRYCQLPDQRRPKLQQLRLQEWEQLPSNRGSMSRLFRLRRCQRRLFSVEHKLWRNT
jgi:hypothetical protein